MAREALPIAGAIIGAAVGSAFGNPMLGAQVGFMLGSIGSAILFPPDPLKGPKLEDRRIQTSSYGQPKSYCYGTIAVTGTIIWAPDLEAVTTEDEIGKGGGQEVETTSYYANVAIHLCKGPIDAIIRLWADDELILDRRSSNEGAAQLPTLKFRLYLGAGDQDPDPLIEEVEGVGNVPAWPDEAYLLLEDFPVGRYGNRLPNFRAEVVATFTDAYPVVDVGSDSGLTSIALDPVAYQIVTMGSTAQRIDPISNEVIFSKTNPLGSGSYRGTPTLQPDGKYYYQIFFSGSLESFHRVYKIDAFTFESVGGVGNDTSVGSLPGAENSAVIQIYTIPGGVTPEGEKIDNYVGVAWDDSWVFVWDCNGAGAAPSYVSHFRISTDLSHGIGGSTQGAGVAVSPDGYLWCGVFSAAGSPNACKLLKVYIDRLGSDPEANATVETSFDLSGYIDVVLAMTYDAAENALLILGDTEGGGGNVEYILKFDLDSETITAFYRPAGVSAIGVVSNWGTWQQGPVNGNLYVMDGGGDLHIIRTSDMTLVEEIEYTNYTSFAAFDAVIYDPLSDAIWLTHDTQTEVKKHLLHRGDSGTTTLRAIMTDIASRCGYDVTGAPSAASPDINVTQQTQTVRGFAWSLAPARNVLQQLLDFFAVDWIEQDGLLRGVNRGAAAVATLDDDDDFGAHVPGSGSSAASAIREPVRTEEDETGLPLTLTVRYLDVDDDYAPGSQISRRVAEAVDAVRDDVEDYAIAATGDEAAQVAERRLWQRWIGRWSYSGTLDWSWLRFVASDPVTLTDNDDAVRVRLTSIDIGDNLLMKLAGVAEDSTALYTASNAAQGGTTTGSGAQPSSLPIPGAAILVLMDTLPFREVDDSFGFYYAVGSYRPLTEWEGAAVRRSNDGLTYTTFDSVPASQGAKIGRSLTALGAPPVSPWCWDRENTVTVAMHNGTLASVTEADVLGGSNWAWLGGEVIGFQTVTDNGDGTYTLADLLRARRHTDDKTDTHVIGETFVLLSLTSARIAVTDSSEQDVTRYYKANSFGWLFNEAPISFANTGRRLKPPRVTDVEGDRSGSPSGLSISWIRRDRLSWSKVLGPLGNSEESEAYEIDVMQAGSPDTVLRTLTSSTNSVFYSDAQQITDFGSVPASVTVRIYQMSATVGRGIAKEVTL